MTIAIPLKRKHRIDKRVKSVTRQGGGDSGHTKRRKLAQADKAKLRPATPTYLLVKSGSGRMYYIHGKA